jgi:F-type H+-transporting ATPase subunit epsilon
VALDQTILPKRHLVERPQLAGVQRCTLLAQQVGGGQTDAQMLVGGALVEGIRLARQLDLAVQWLVLYAQQHAEEVLKDRTGGMDLAEAQAELLRAVAQLRAIEKLRKMKRG